MTGILDIDEIVFTHLFGQCGKCLLNPRVGGLGVGQYRDFSIFKPEAILQHSANQFYIVQCSVKVCKAAATVIRNAD